jgi:hypothetical protein
MKILSNHQSKSDFLVENVPVSGKFNEYKDVLANIKDSNNNIGY